MSGTIFPDSFRHKRHDSAKLLPAPLLCYVTLANNQVFQIEVDHKADGQEVIDKLLGIFDEGDYFGIQFTGCKKELLWINSRNRLSKQILSSSPYHLYFKVKYFVIPSSLQLEETRNQFYINVVHHLKNGLWDGQTELEIQCRLIALMAYVQFGNYNPNTTPCKYACFWPECRGEIPAEAIRMAATFHQQLRDNTVSHAKYEVLSIVSENFPLYGTYFYEAKDVHDKKVLLGVGPNDITLCTNDGVINERYLYCRVHTVTNSARVVTLSLLEDDGSVKNQNYQLSTVRLANAIYRSITEVHAFFQTDSIRPVFLNQTTRDTGMFGGVFDHNGKEFTFDVKYTFFEVLDRARRRLFRCANNISKQPLTLDSPNDGDIKKDIFNQKSSGNNTDIQELVEERLREAAICRICMVEPISRVFFPCGHTICCSGCAERVNMCPICRKSIDFRHPCFLPWEVDSTISTASSQAELLNCSLSSLPSPLASTQISFDSKATRYLNSPSATTSGTSAMLNNLHLDSGDGKQTLTRKVLDSRLSVDQSSVNNSDEQNVNKKKSNCLVQVSSLPQLTNPATDIHTQKSDIQQLNNQSKLCQEFTPQTSMSSLPDRKILPKKSQLFGSDEIVTAPSTCTATSSSSAQVASTSFLFDTTKCLKKKTSTKA